MSFLEQVIAILALLCCSWQVCSDPTIYTKNYIISEKILVDGANHIDKTKLVYALCESSADAKTFQCTIIFERNPFDPTNPPYSCDVRISTELENGKLVLIGVELLTADRVLFMWEMIESNNSKESMVTLEKINMTTCDKLEHKFRIETRDDKVPQVFVTTVKYDDSYLFSFMSTSYCDDRMCKVTVFSDGSVGRITPWFRKSLVHTLESIDRHHNKFLVTIGETEQDAGVVKYYVLDGLRRRKLATSAYIGELGWSSFDGVISLCGLDECRRYSHLGELMDTLKLDLETIPAKYLALYELPFRGYLALICDGVENSPYRVIMIGEEGQQEYIYDLERFRCSDAALNTAAKFFMKNYHEFCLSIFDKINQDLATFEIYCFPMEDLFQINHIQI